MDIIKIKLNPILAHNVILFIQASVLKGQKENIVTEYILKVCL